MATEVDASVIKRTQEVLGKYVKKPQLTEKLLQKPPFRFIHDVICAVIKDTGFLKGLYSADELNSGNVKDRTTKMQFLQKLIDVIKIITKEDILAKPSKIVAGQEPEKTNELLTAVGRAIEKKLDSRKGIEEWKQGQKKGKSKPEDNKKKTKPSAGKGKENVEVKRQDSVKIDKSLDETDAKARIDSGIILEEPDNSPSEIPLEEPMAEEKPPTPPALDQDLIKPVTGQPNISEEKPHPVISEKEEMINAIDQEAERRRTIPKSKPKDDKMQKKNSVEAESKPPVPSRKNSDESVSLQALGKPQESRPNKPLMRTSLRPPSVRPASARPGAPKRRDNNVEIILQPDETVKLGDINVKVEQFNLKVDQDDDDENLIVIEDTPDSILDQQAQSKPEDLITLSSDVEHQGHLVKQILETQKGLTGDHNVDEAHQWKVNESHSKQMTDLRNHIQKLTKSVQPLGKFTDFLLEDVDSMQREFSMWFDREKEAQRRLNRDKDSIENAVESLKHQLEDIIQSVQEQRDHLDSVRGNILQNEEKILNLFRNG